MGPLRPHGGLTGVQLGHLVSFNGLFWEAGELQRDDISIFVFQRGTIVATCRAHRSLVGASCEFLGALWEAGSS